MRAPGSRGRPRVEAADSDEVLVARAIAGERRAFDELYDRHVDTVWRWLTRLLGPDAEREDLTQQIFSDVFDTLPRFRGEARFTTFLYRIVVNTAVDQLGRRRRRRHRHDADGAALAEVVPDPGRTPEQSAEERQQMANVFELLDRIKPKKRVAFLLRVVEGLSLEEVAEIVNASVPTVAQRVRHAAIELRALQARREGRSVT
jgi:RNA polymerase sigma-70 factor, ECF subfamily